MTKRHEALMIGNGAVMNGLSYALTEELCDRALAGLAGRADDHAILGLRRMRERTRALQGQPANETIAACRELLTTARELTVSGYGSASYRSRIPRIRSRVASRPARSSCGSQKISSRQWLATTS